MSKAEMTAYLQANGIEPAIVGLPFDLTSGVSGISACETDFNAGAETVATKPMFRAAFKRSRCVIPASSYYEWKPTPSGKQPYYISARDGSVLSFAGLWDEQHGVETGEPVKSCSIIVTAANAMTRQIHDRMPVMPEQFEP